MTKKVFILQIHCILQIMKNLIQKILIIVLHTIKYVTKYIKLRWPLSEKHRYEPARVLARHAETTKGGPTKPAQDKGLIT